MGRMWVTCKSHANTHGHMWVTCRSHANTYRAHVGHVQVTCECIQGTCGSHAGHMRVTIECVWSVLRLRNPLLSYRKAGGCQITHGNTNKLWKASLLAGPRSAAACELESLGPSAPLLPERPVASISCSTLTVSRGYSVSCVHARPFSPL